MLKSITTGRYNLKSRFITSNFGLNSALHLAEYFSNLDSSNAMSVTLRGLMSLMVFWTTAHGNKIVELRPFNSRIHMWWRPDQQSYTAGCQRAWHECKCDKNTVSGVIPVQPLPLVKPGCLQWPKCGSWLPKGHFREWHLTRLVRFVFDFQSLDCNHSSVFWHNQFTRCSPSFSSMLL